MVESKNTGEPGSVGDEPTIAPADAQPTDAPAVVDREAVKAALLEQAEAIVSKWDTYNVRANIPGKKIVVKTFSAGDGLQAAISKYIAQKMCMDVHVKELIDNRDFHLAKMMPTSTFTRLPDQPGCQAYAVNINTKASINDRAYIACHYDYVKEDGTRIHIESTKDCEQLRKDHADKLTDKAVLCDIPLGYISYKQEEDGLHITVISIVKMQARVPNFFISFAHQKNTTGAKMIEDYIVDGTVPPLNVNQ